MADNKLTNEKMLTFTGHEKLGAFSAGPKLTEFGLKQNDANQALALNVNDLIKRVCALEEKQLQQTEVMRRVAEELGSFKKELDRLRLSDKLNTSAVERLDKAIKTLQGDNE